MITQFSDSCGWKSRRLSQAGLHHWVPGRRGPRCGETCVGTCRFVLAGALSQSPAGAPRTPENSAECQSIGVLHILQHASWVMNREKECRQGGNVEFRKLYPKCCFVEHRSSLDAALQSGRRAVQTRQVGSCSVRRGDAKEQLVYYF